MERTENPKEQRQYGIQNTTPKPRVVWSFDASVLKIAQPTSEDVQRKLANLHHL